MALEDYYGKNVEVLDTYGNTHSGKMSLYVQPNDNDGKEAIALSSGVWLDEDEIKSIKEV